MFLVKNNQSLPKEKIAEALRKEGIDFFESFPKTQKEIDNLKHALESYLYEIVNEENKNTIKQETLSLLLFLKEKFPEEQTVEFILIKEESDDGGNYQPSLSLSSEWMSRLTELQKKLDETGYDLGGDIEDTLYEEFYDISYSLDLSKMDFYDELTVTFNLPIKLNEYPC